MTTALEDLKGATVQRRSIAANMASILQVEHAVAVDDPTVLSEGEEVTFTDEEVGFQFQGKVTTVSPNFDTGEGVVYFCADTYRTLAKTPGFITGANGKQSARVKFGDGAKMKTVINALLAEIPTGVLFPGGVDLSALPDPDIPTTDKGGQYLDAWIDDLLENTEGGIARVDPNDGLPKLVFEDFYAQPDITLEIGDFNIIIPTIDGNPVMESANVGKTLDRKFKRIIVEGCGEFTRREDVYIQPIGTQLSDAFNTTRFKMTFPEKRVLGRLLDVDGKCFDQFILKFSIGFDSGLSLPNMFTFFFTNPANFLFEETDGQMFALVDIRRGSNNPSTIVVAQAWATYTSYDGPITAEIESADPALDNEGDLWEDHPEYFKFTGATSIDETSKLQPIADHLFKRFSELPDTSGTVRIHIKGINPDIKVGSRITNTEFDGGRVQKIDIDYVERSMLLDVSTLPFREVFELFKRQLQEKTVPRGGWLSNRTDEGETNCFCGGAVYTDESGGGGGGTQGGGGGGQPGGESWDCIQCHCVQQNNVNGQFATEADCLRVCNDEAPGGYTFVNCVGCVCAEQGGAFATLAACEAANPNPINDADCDYICTSTGCSPVPTGQGQYGTLAACQAACVPAGGSGDDGTSHSLGQGTIPSISTSVTPLPEAGGPCGAAVTASTFTIVAPSFAGLSSETPVVTLIKEIITDTCGRVITVNVHPAFSILPKWQ